MMHFESRESNSSHTSHIRFSDDEQSDVTLSQSTKSLASGRSRPSGANRPRSFSKFYDNCVTKSFGLEDAASHGFTEICSLASTMFEDMNAESVKSSVRKSFHKDRIASLQLMKREGLWQSIAKHPFFTNGTLFVISCNAVWIAIDTDWNKASSLAESDTVFVFMENVFCSFFLFEWVVRLLAFRNALEGFLKDAWFVFDGALLVLMIAETWVVMLVGNQVLDGTSIFRLFRLLRLSRLVRLLRSMPELIILVRGMFTAMKSVLYVMCLLVLATYIFAIALTTLADGTSMGKIYFDNVALSMYSLFVYATLIDELASFCDAIRAESEVCLVLVLIFVCLSCLTLMNMLIGVLCDTVSGIALAEKKEIAAATVTSALEGIALELDENFDGFVSYQEFKSIIEKPEALKALEVVGIDAGELEDLADLMFTTVDRKEKALSFGTFMENILELRHSQHARLRDIRYVWNELDPKTHEMKDCLKAVDSRFEKVERGVSDVMKEVALLAAKVK